MNVSFQELTVGRTYRMASDGGRRFSRGDRVVVLEKQPGSQFCGSRIVCSPVEGNTVFEVSGASWFTTDTEEES